MAWKPWPALPLATTGPKGSPGSVTGAPRKVSPRKGTMGRKASVDKASRIAAPLALMVEA